MVIEPIRIYPFFRYCFLGYVVLPSFCLRFLLTRCLCIDRLLVGTQSRLRGGICRHGAPLDLRGPMLQGCTENKPYASTTLELSMSHQRAHVKLWHRTCTIQPFR